GHARQGISDLVQHLGRLWCLPRVRFRSGLDSNRGPSGWRPFDFLSRSHERRRSYPADDVGSAQSGLSLTLDPDGTPLFRYFFDREFRRIYGLEWNAAHAHWLIDAPRRPTGTHRRT